MVPIQSTGTGSFGFQIMGGYETEIPPTVEFIVPGGWGSTWWARWHLVGGAALGGQGGTWWVGQDLVGKVALGGWGSTWWVGQDCIVTIHHILRYIGCL